ncbi:LysE family translocator [Zymobacter palmae]|uniref:Putative threonine efflux protein n=1 Tax=Zymobacter palmae TaxID=33074 RepID=A0A348HC35_9GAMM|nr:LysE family translocator [Zymobacter palmae]BBG29187.1 putative threonine efflux protein [Zymobacter palmae]
MTDLSLLLAFVAAAFILTITPGIDTALVLRSSATGGQRSAVAASLGVTLGCLFWGAAAAIGLGALLRASELAYGIVCWVGALYLVWLGVRLIIRPRTTFEAGHGGTGERGTREAFLRGLLTNLLNPKVGVFYVTFLPQFVPASVNIAGYTFFLACLHVLITLVWFGILIAAMVPMARFLRKPKIVTALDRLTGCVFIAFGVKLAFASSK